ncbi:MAG: HAD-IA family hydrolase [Acidobacteriota bacterium]|nr:HAD-IA family hydrolase [Acidobacteriota bacterium]
MDSLIVFDMDGVLAEVTESYRESIVQTVRYFTGQTVTRDTIQDYKNQGGWNNDWALSQKIAADLGTPVEYETVIEKFNEFFLGENGNGLVTRESWFPKPGLLDRLAASHGLSLFTGRLRYEADITLRRFAPGVKFDPVICADDVTAAKPAPEGLVAIQQRKPRHKLWYVGDTVDDARCARAAGVPFIGIAARTHTKRDELIRLFQSENAVAILENINEIEGAL